MSAALDLRPANGLRRWTYHCLFGLLAVTGMRISEALALRRDGVDLTAGILVVHETKFGKSRLVPVHPTVSAEVNLIHLGEDPGFLPPMLTQEQAVEIKVLARRGTAVREIARQTGLSRTRCAAICAMSRRPVTSNASHAQRSSTRSRAICSSVLSLHDRTGFQRQCCFGSCGKLATKAVSASSRHSWHRASVLNPNRWCASRRLRANRCRQTSRSSAVAARRYWRWSRRSDTAVQVSCASPPARMRQRCASACAKRLYTSAARPSRCSSIVCYSL